ncbi:MAG: FAD-dependent oxidoreductase [Anaeromyxobacteraceae bacterium]
MNAVRDAVVVGGGPAGLAFALAAARRGHAVTVLERRTLPVDKACGEGVLPGGVRVLRELGVLLDPVDAAPIRELRWIDGDGTVARVALPAPGGLGVRRLALSAALAEQARRAGVEVVDDEAVVSHRREPDRMVVETGRRVYAGRLLVAADGLGSPTRRRARLDRPLPGTPQRFGLRRHFALPPWSEAVEVHLGDGVEAYVTPAGARRVGVAFLFEPARTGVVSFDTLLARFPALEAALSGAQLDSMSRGAGPLARAATARTADRLVLLGDAAGYLDAATGEGISLALGCAVDLAGMLPGVLAAGATRDALRGYEVAWRCRFLPYWAYTRAMLGLLRRPGLRRRVLGLAASAPAPFERLVAAAVG